MGTVQAKFGIGKKKKSDAQTESGEPIDFEDPALLAAMEIFAGMSPEEMEETMQELVGLLGDDAETLAAMKEVMDEIQNLEASDTQSSLKQMIADDEIAAATQDALKMLHKTDWETIWERKDDILEAVIQSGQIEADDAALFKSDKEAWEKELKFIWSELQRQATETDDAGRKGDEL
jgi:hypothetical protein